MSLNLQQLERRFSHRLTRRDALRVGGLGVLGLTLPQLLRAEEQSNGRSLTGKSARAKSCILFFMEGGPSHVDLWDMKPNAPEQVRGIFQPLATSLPGFHVAEVLPRWAPLAHRLTVVRSVSHTIVDHNAGTYFALTGHPPLRGGQLIVAPSQENAPPIGSVVAKLQPSGGALPDFVHLPDIMFNNGHFIPGQGAGFLGDAFDPFMAGDPSRPNYCVPGLETQLETGRVERRRSLLGSLDEGRLRDGRNRPIARLDTFYEKAFSLIRSDATRRAFDLSQEPQSLRERYGLGFERKSLAREFGGLPNLGQSLLLSRRLIEAGVRLVTVMAGRRYDQSFDTHRDHFPLLKQSLCPYLDRGFSALIEDMAERGLLDETLVVAMGEFGRTPKLGQITSGAGAESDGRDHWPHCYTVFFAGGGMRPGMIYGASDATGAYPADNPVGPQEIAATVYAALGIDPQTRILDKFNRPHTLADGQPINELFA